MRRLIRNLFLFSTCLAEVLFVKYKTDPSLKRYSFNPCEDEDGDCTCGGVCREYAGQKGVARADRR